METKILLLLCLIGVAVGSVFQSAPSVHRDHPGKCWLEGLGVAISPGQSYSKLGECTKYFCRSDFSYSGQSCGSMAIDIPNCYISKIDNTKLYPECCPKVVCDDKQ